MYILVTHDNDIIKR